MRFLAVLVLLLSPCRARAEGAKDALVKVHECLARLALDWPKMTEPEVMASLEYVGTIPVSIREDEGVGRIRDRWLKFRLTTARGYYAYLIAPPAQELPDASAAGALLNVQGRMALGVASRPGVGPRAAERFFWTYRHFDGVVEFAGTSSVPGLLLTRPEQNVGADDLVPWREASEDTIKIHRELQACLADG